MPFIFMLLLAIGSLLLIVLLLALYFLRASLPRYDGEITLAGLASKVTVLSDAFAVPSVMAQSRLDAFCALGYLVARDRLFQMDTLRRLVSGHLSEVYGQATVQFDVKQRTLGFKHVATAALNKLPAEQREILQAYATGVNAYLAQVKVLPPEFLALRYTPEAWTPLDSLLIGLYLFQNLSEQTEKFERAATVMEKLLPPEVFRFFTSDEDTYTHVLLGGNETRRPLQPLPVEALKAVLRQSSGQPETAFLDAAQQVQGSNSWLLSPARTRDGRTLLANDMHLGLSVPNIWYRAELHYDETSLCGLTVPGFPTIMLGSNGQVVWGFTNTCCDVLDLVEIEQNDANENEYKVPQGWREFELTEEQIQVKNRLPHTFQVKSTIWGPVSPSPLLGRQVALRWTALDPEAINMNLVNMDRASTLPEALAIIRTFGAPPMNAMLADANGHIGWTYCGKLPIRIGFDGLTSKSWSHNDIGWKGYIPPDELPCVVDPPDGFLVTANNLTLGKEYPYVVSGNYVNSYRSWRIREQLKTIENATEQSMFALQLDTTTEFYAFYADLILELLTQERLQDNPHLVEAREALLAWDRKAELHSQGIGLLVRLRERIAEKVLGAYFAPCLEADPTFQYSWNSFEAPLRLLLTEKLHALLPPGCSYATWEALIVETVGETVLLLKKKYRVRDLRHLTWGKMHRARVVHPLARGNKLLALMLNMRTRPLPGTPFCIRASSPGYGVTARLVVSPQSPTAGLFHMPTGQAGHPFERSYRDQHQSWIQGEPLAFSAGKAVHTLVLHPHSREK